MHISVTLQRVRELNLWSVCLLDFLPPGDTWDIYYMLFIMVTRQTQTTTELSNE